MTFWQTTALIAASLLACVLWLSGVILSRLGRRYHEAAARIREGVRE